MLMMLAGLEPWQRATVLVWGFSTEPVQLMFMFAGAHCGPWDGASHDAV